MKRQEAFELYLIKNNCTMQYRDYCEKIEKAFGGKDMDEIIISYRYLSQVKEKLRKVTTNENSISQYIVGLNHYLKFAFSASTVACTSSTIVDASLYHVAMAEGVAVTPEVEFAAKVLEYEYASIIKFANSLLCQNIETPYIPIIISDEMPVNKDSIIENEKILGIFSSCHKPYIEIYYRNFNSHDAAKYRNCLAHEYFHYLHYAYAGVEFSKARKELVEGMADFFAILYSIYRHEKNDLRVAKHCYNLWKKYFGTSWPYASALYYYQVSGVELKYSSNYDDYYKHGCIGKFVQNFYNLKQPDVAYDIMKNT